MSTKALPSSHLSLLTGYVQSRIYIITETSSNIQDQLRELKEWAETYAQRNNLAPPHINWEDYLI